MNMLIRDFILTGGAALVITGLLTLLLRKKDSIARPGKKRSLFALRFVALWYAVTAVAVLFNVRTILQTFEFRMRGFAIYHGPLLTNFVPFSTILASLSQHDIVQVLGNILLFVPFPIVLHFCFPKLKRGAFLLIVFCVTALIEPLQLLVNFLVQFNTNIIDIDDFILNALGSALGLLALALLLRVSRRKRRPRYDAN